MKNRAWVYIDHNNGKVLPASWEVITAALQIAKDLGSGVTALVIGNEVGALAQEAIQHGADEVVSAESAALLEYRAEPYADALVKAVKDNEVEVLLFPTTGRGRELAGMAAVDLETGVMPDALSLEVDQGKIMVTRPVFGGKATAKVSCSALPQIITVRGRVFAPPAVDPAREGTVRSLALDLTEKDIKTEVVDNLGTGGGVSLSDASVVVAGGRGVSTSAHLSTPDGLDAEAAEMWRAEQGFKLIRELADELAAAIGASRAAVDAGYIDYEYQIGQTGKIVSPDIYIACGLSGAIQHLAGMRNSKLIVAINDEADAPIFKFAHVGVVGDMHQILPAVIEELKIREK